MEINANNPELTAKEKPVLLDKQKWMALIAEWENSNESQKAFCERLQLNPHTFSYMRGKILAKKNRKANKFIAVKIKEDVSTHSPSSQLLIENNKGIKLHVSVDISEAKLLQILKVIGWHHA